MNLVLLKTSGNAFNGEGFTEAHLLLAAPGQSGTLISARQYQIGFW